MEEEVFAIDKNPTEDEYSEESEVFKKEINELYESKELRNLMSNNELMKTTMIDINDEAIKKSKLNKSAEALVFLKRAEKTLEFAASCGKSIDRNVIIVILYNIACVYQSLWKLEKCAKYIDAVIYNITDSLEEASASATKDGLSADFLKEMDAMRLKKMKFLIHSYLQYCAILSQINKHEDAKKNALEALKTINNVFKLAYKYAFEIKSKSDFSDQKSKIQAKNFASTTHAKNRSLATSSTKSTSEFLTFANEILKPPSKPKEENLEKSNPLKMDIPFKKILIDYAFPILKDLSKTADICCLTDNNRQEVLLEVKKSLYFWKKNPENNERDLRKELKAPKENNITNKRSLLGVKSDSTEWIENFNIGSIMHMNPVKYDDFCFFGDLNYEISKNQLLEKVIFQSICFFTIATEMRFIEIEKHSSKVSNTKDIQSDDYKLSELYHLKAIEIVCKYIKEDCPYINHLITSYHKHYNSDLDVIQEESFYSNAVKKSDDEDNVTNTNESSNKTTSDPRKIACLENKDIKISENPKKSRENLFSNLKGKGIVPIDKKTSLEKAKENFLGKKTLNLACYKALINEKKIGFMDENLQMSKVKAILQSLQLKEKLKLSKPDGNHNIQAKAAQIKNKSLSARTHNEVNLNNENYIEQLKRLNVYDELLALKKLPTTKINNLTNEKPKGSSDTEQQIAEKMADIKKKLKEGIPSKIQKATLISKISPQTNNNVLAFEKIPKLNLESLNHNKNEEKCFFSPREKISNI